MGSMTVSGTVTPLRLSKSVFSNSPPLRNGGVADLGRARRDCCGEGSSPGTAGLFSPAKKRSFSLSTVEVGLVLTVGGPVVAPEGVEVVVVAPEGEPSLAR